MSKNYSKLSLIQHFFWSGLGKNGAEIAKEVAKSNGGVTLEMLMEQNKQKLIEAGFPYDEDFDRFIWNGTDPENVKAWKDLSKAYASQASGNVRALRKNFCKFNNSDKKRYCGAA